MSNFLSINACLFHIGCVEKATKCGFETTGINGEVFPGSYVIRARRKFYRDVIVLTLRDPAPIVELFLKHRLRT